MCPATATPPKKWTVMMYNASDNELYAYQMADVEEARQVGTNDSLNLLATVDHAPNGGVGQRLEMHSMGSLVKKELPQCNMSDPKNLTEFVEWGMQNYPAENYWLVISDHGDAWKGALEDHGQEGWMSLPQLGDALKQVRDKTGRKLDLLSFDCCYMGSLEVAHQLKDAARYMVGSQQEVGWCGHDYGEVLPGIDELSPRQVAERLVESGRRHQKEYMTLAAVDLEKVPALTEAVKQLGKEMLGQPADKLRKAVDRTEVMWEYHDASDLAAKLAEEVPALQPAARAVQERLAEAVFAEQHIAGHPNAHGLQIETKRDLEGWGYGATAFAQDTGWDKVIDHLSTFGLERPVGQDSGPGNEN